MSTLKFSIVTPEGTAIQKDALSVTLPTLDGEITVLPRHIPLIGSVIPGTILVRTSEGEEIYAVSRGVVEVDGMSIQILADTADRAEDLQESAIEKAKASAEKLMTERRNDAEGFAEAAAMLERELARLKTVRRHRTIRRMPHSES